MKRLYTIGLSGFVVLTTFAQLNFPVPRNEIVIGKNYKINTDIKATEYVFPQKIYKFGFDTASDLLILQLREVNKLGLAHSVVAVYDLSNKKLLWNRVGGYTLQEGNIIIHRELNKCYRYKIETGAYQWEAKNWILYIDLDRKIGIGYRSKGDYGIKNILEGIDLTNGLPIWKREVSFEYSLNNIYYLNDSVIVVAAAGLHTVNLSNGTGWDYNAVTGEKDYTNTIMANVLGILAGGVTGFTVLSFGHDLISELASNVLIDSSNIYFASRDRIVRLGHDGEIKWNSSLPDNLVSQSSIFIKDSLLYMINTGYAYFDFNQTRFGMPFIAAFDIKNGMQLFLRTITGQINDFKIHKDTILLLHNERISCHSAINGSVISERSFDTLSMGNLSIFAGSPGYHITDSIYTSIVSSDPHRFYIATTTRKIIVVNDKLEILNQVNHDELFRFYIEAHGYKFLENEGETTVIDSQNKKVAGFKASITSKLIGSKLYDIQEKSVFEIELLELIK